MGVPSVRRKAIGEAPLLRVLNHQNPVVYRRGNEIVKRRDTMTIEEQIADLISRGISMNLLSIEIARTVMALIQPVESRLRVEEECTAENRHCSLRPAKDGKRICRGYLPRPPTPAELAELAERFYETRPELRLKSGELVMLDQGGGK